MGFTDITFRSIGKPEVGVNGYTGFRPNEKVVLKKGSSLPGWSEGEQCLPLGCDILYERDIEIKVRDGARLYVDILRPAHATENVPCVISWSPYGKEYSTHDMVPVCTWKCGIKSSDLSGREKFEGVDPARWCPRGYAVAHVDIRGAGNSDGGIEVMTKRMTEDCYDVIEALAKFDWCNGNIGMAGNSFLAISQWHVAALRPPSLKAIAPWEGSSDPWREHCYRGGLFNLGNMALIATLIWKGKNQQAEDWDQMYDRFPLACEYWNEKRADLSKIDIPVFMTGSDFSSIHTMGAIRGWLEVKSKVKMFKWSGYQEWHELYALKESQEELMDWFDPFLRGVKNDFIEKTPPVRWSILQYGDREPIHDVVLDDFPPKNTEYKTFYLGSDAKLSSKPVEANAIHSCDAKTEAGLTYDIKFDKDTRILGLPKAHIFMSCPDHDDWTVFVRIRKLDKNGKVLQHLQVPRERAWAASIDEIKPEDQSGVILHQGSFGVLRASHRAIDRSRSIHENFPFHHHDREEKIEPGKVIELEIGIWALGVHFDAGESAQIHISGFDPRNPELKGKFGVKHRVEDENVGTMQIHVGPDYPSRVILPFVPVN